MSTFLYKKNKLFLAERAFTIIELMVTITIVVLVTGVIMLQYSSFNSSVLLTSQAYLTAFDIREAQSLAIGVRGQGGQFREEYGLYFNMRGANPNQYLLFQDNVAFGAHDPARYQAGEQIGVPYLVDPRFSIVNICATNSSGRTCYVDDPATAGETVNATMFDIAITFKRPDFDADFYNAGKANIQSVEIMFGTQGSAIVRTVNIEKTGQINVR